jgi:hypothetical protein
MISIMMKPIRRDFDGIAIFSLLFYKYAPPEPDLSSIFLGLVQLYSGRVGTVRKRGGQTYPFPLPEKAGKGYLGFYG